MNQKEAGLQVNYDKLMIFLNPRNPCSPRYSCRHHYNLMPWVILSKDRVVGKDIYIQAQCVAGCHFDHKQLRIR
tara:strand:- start:363 stop:584 length:222 start_codon:yes stop_codon:yes gene_type:complete